MRQGPPKGKPEAAAAPATVTGEVAHTHWRRLGRGATVGETPDPQAGRPASTEDLTADGVFRDGQGGQWPPLRRMTCP